MPAIIDGGFIALLMISSILAFARGFTRELLSSLAVFCAAIGSFFSFSFLEVPVAAALTPMVSERIAGVLVIVCVFLLIYVAVTVVTASISAIVIRNEQVNFADRAVGLVFGVARGFVLVALLMVVAFSAQAALEDNPSLTGEAQNAARFTSALKPTMAYGATHALANTLITACPDQSFCDIAPLPAHKK